MDDLISRQKALKFTVSHGINIGAKIYVPLGDVTEYLRDLPSAQPEQIARDIATILENESDMRVMLKNAEQRWIPCSERMPEPVAPSQRREWFITSNQYGGVACTCYEFEASPFKVGWQTDMTILAWMSLPEPYKAERKEE